MSKIFRIFRKTHLLYIFLPLGASILFLVLSLLDFQTLKPLGKDVILRFTILTILGGILLIFAFHLLKRLFRPKIATTAIYILAFSPLLFQNLPVANIRYTLSSIAQLSQTSEPILVENGLARLVALFYSSADHPVYSDETKIPKNNQKFWVIDRADAEPAMNLNFLSDGYHTAVELEKMTDQ